mgnify:CR=1 FL=1
MSGVADLIGGIFLLIGASFILLAGIGTMRFGDTYSRMHTAAKAPTLGIICIGIGAGLVIRSVEATVAITLVVGLKLVALPVGGHVLARSLYRSGGPELLGPDELAQDEGREQPPVA